MVGKDKHQWSATQGTIVDVRPGRHEHRYLIDARNRSGAMIQHEVKHRSPQPYSVGSTVRVEISALNEIRFDPNVGGSSGQLNDRGGPDRGGVGGVRPARCRQRPELRAAQRARRRLGHRELHATYSNTSGAAAGLGGMPDGMAGISQGLAGLASAIGAMVGSSTTHIIGPDGRELQVDPTEMQRLTQALTSGDNAERMEAIKQLHRIKAAAMTHVAQRAADGTLGAGGGGLAAGGSASRPAGQAGRPAQQGDLDPVRVRHAAPARSSRGSNANVRSSTPTRLLLSTRRSSPVLRTKKRPPKPGYVEYRRRLAPDS